MKTSDSHPLVMHRHAHLVAIWLPLYLATHSLIPTHWTTLQNKTCGWIRPILTYEEGLFCHLSLFAWPLFISGTGQLAFVPFQYQLILPVSFLVWNHCWSPDFNRVKWWQQSVLYTLQENRDNLWNVLNPVPGSKCGFVCEAVGLSEEEKLRGPFLTVGADPHAKKHRCPQQARRSSVRLSSFALKSIVILDFTFVQPEHEDYKKCQNFMG